MQGNSHATTRRSWEEPRLVRKIKSKRRESVYRSRAALLTRGELVFFWSLRGAVASRCLIMCKVRLADAVTCSEAEWRAGAGNAISQKHLDFVLCDAHSTRFLVAIELDDRSHARPERRRRDRFVEQALSQAGIRLIRFRARSKYCKHEIRNQLDEVLASCEAV